VAAAVLAVAFGATGCSSLGEMMSGSKVDYKSASQQTRGLEVPPDLTQLAREGRYQPPTAVVSAATASATPGTRPQAGGAPTVAPAALGGMAIQRDGDTRWLVVPMTPEQLWPQLRAFWLESGFRLMVDDPTVGVLETDWAENRAKLPQDFLRSTLGRVFENIYDTGERDRFRTRIERTAAGTEIFISHRGLSETVSGPQKDVTRWTVRPADPQLEAEFLGRLMVRLGSAEATARTALAAPAAEAPARARLLEGQPVPAVEVDDGFDRAWRRVGLALDRSGFTVEDRNRTDGLYYVRYVDADAPDDRGFLSRLFSSSKDEAGKAQRYRIALVGGAAATGGRTVVLVQNAEGAAPNPVVGQRIAGVLLSELK
jgi:outer membrane protein assembly factor BamC